MRGFFHQTVCVCVSRWNSGEGGILFFPRRKVAVHFSQQQRLPETISSRTAAGACSVEQSEMNFCTPNTLTHTHTQPHILSALIPIYSLRPGLRARRNVLVWCVVCRQTEDEPFALDALAPGRVCPGVLKHSSKCIIQGNTFQQPILKSSRVSGLVRYATHASYPRLCPTPGEGVEIHSDAFLLTCAVFLGEVVGRGILPWRSRAWCTVCPPSVCLPRL